MRVSNLLTKPLISLVLVATSFSAYSFPDEFTRVRCFKDGVLWFSNTWIGYCEFQYVSFPDNEWTWALLDDPELPSEPKTPLEPGCEGSSTPSQPSPTPQSFGIPNAGPNPRVGDPIIVSTGNSYQTQVDYKSPHSFGLNFIRTYNSSSVDESDYIGVKWRHNHSQYVIVVGDNQSAYVYRNNGQIFTFDGTNNWQGEPDVVATLKEVTNVDGSRSGWVYRDQNDIIEKYNALGQLISVTNRNGQTHHYEYDLSEVDGGDDNRLTLDKVIGAYSEIMRFSYDGTGHISSMTAPDGRIYQYSYDEANRLTAVIYPEQDGVIPTRIYHYEDVNFPNNLTGITDETGVRYVTWAYDSQGRTISSELAGGVDKVTLNFDMAEQVTVTNPLGKQTTYHFTSIHGVQKVTQVEGHASANCAAANKDYTYDENGFMNSKTDWKGNVTTYTNNERGLVTSRTEAAGTSAARTITTEWHSEFRVPIKITEPGRVAEFTYDSQGKLLSTSITEQPEE